MRENHVKSSWARGEAVLNGWLHIPSSLTAEVMAQAGFGSLTLDMQHGLIHPESVLPMLQAISTTETTPLARVPWNEPGIIMRVLDAGCYGVICPMVSTAAEAEAFVGACRYPPLGYRSYGPTRATLYGGPDYAARANDTVLTFAMIETAEAMENLDAILSVSGLDALYVGPADLSQALGGPPGVDFEEGPVPAALDTILAAAARRGVVAGIHTATPSYAKKMIDKGFSFVTVDSDLRYLSRGAKAVLDAFKDDVSDADKLQAQPSPY